MIANKIDVNSINVDLDGSTFIIKYPNVNYSYWKNLIPYNGDKDIIIILSNILVQLDCTIMFSNQRLLYTHNMMYEYYVSEYYYYLLHIEHQWLYNNYFDLLIFKHIHNIKFEQDNPIIITPPKIKSKRLNHSKIINMFVRQVTTNMFTKKEAYIYSNAKTGEVIQSDDSNLLDTLNAKPVKEKRTKVVGVSLDDMTFSFKKKE